MSEALLPEHLNISNEFLKAIISESTKKLFEILNKFFHKKKDSGTSKEVDDEMEVIISQINSHINYIYNWSDNIEFFGLSSPVSTTSSTIELNISFNLRQLTDKRKDENLITENELLLSENPYFIIGDPGSGKTTLIKRLLRKYIETSNIYDIPLLVRFRDINENENLYLHLSKLLGLPYEVRQVIKTVKVKVGRNFEKDIFEDKQITYNEYYLFNERIEKILPEILSSKKFLIILDGLDELNANISEEIIENLSDITLKLINSKVIITSRPSYTKRIFQNFKTCEICELNNQQATKIIEFWTTEPTKFQDELKSKSYADLANRPLFLTFLLILFTNKSTKKLPLNSRDVYEEIIDFFLKNWDEIRGIMDRKSKYNSFTTSRKKLFLSELAFYLTYRIKQKVFSKHDLKAAYSLFYMNYEELSIEDSELVANELEHQTGIIVSAFYNLYEFSHLSIQEYLCANYIVKQPYSRLIYDYIMEFPSPLALVIALSSNPSNWFSHIFLHCVPPDSSLSKQSIEILLKRILIEYPRFEKSLELGVALLYITHISDCKNAEFMDLLNRFIDSQENIKASIPLALKRYSYMKNEERELKEGKILLFFGVDTTNLSRFGIDFPNYISCPLDIYESYNQNSR